MSSEQELLDWLSTTFKNVGDDTAILPQQTHNQLITTDISIEDVHFSTTFSTYKQIAYKAMIANVSDIASMGGTPQHAVVSVALPKKNNKNTLKELYRGFEEATKKYKFSIVGGDLSHSKKLIINITIIGKSPKKYTITRSQAKPGDLIYVTNHVGASDVGLQLLKKKKNGKSIYFHQKPTAEIELGKLLAKKGVTAMIDTSDGLATSIHQLCNASKVGATIFSEDVPLHKTTIQDCKKIRKNPLNSALYGGEDYELVFTIPQKKTHLLKKLSVTCIGIVTKNKKVLINNESKQTSLKTGYDHFT